MVLYYSAPSRQTFLLILHKSTRVKFIPKLT